MSSPGPLVLRACTVDRVRAEVRRHDGRIERLSPREVELVAYLVANRDRTLPRDELLTRVWGFSPTVVSRAVDTTVRRLREKIEVDPQRPDHLITAFGEGYRFVLHDPRPSPPIAPEDDPFVGRSCEVDALLGALRAPGVSMLLQGPPGAGKTRIARHLAHRLAVELAGGSLTIDLTEARDLPQVAQAAAGSLGIESPEPGAVTLRRAGEALRGRGPCLVMLDNCEGVPGPVGEALGTWRSTAPEARFLATSRERVGGIDDVVAVGPMPLGDAVALFEILAQRVHPEFRIDADGLPVVEALVERLDRMPLAIALAAGRAGALSPRALLDRLDDRFRLLASRSRDGGGRQRTLRAALDSSWELLGDAERAAFLACATFAGGFDEAAARAVVGPDAPQLLARLCARSLLEARGDRYGGWAFVREYAVARLAVDPDAERAVHRRHAECFAAQVRSLAPGERPVRLSRDRTNLVVATERAAAEGWADLVGATALGTLDVVGREGPFELGVDVARCALAVPGLPDAERVTLGLRLCSLEQWSGVGDPRATLGEAVDLARATGDRMLVAHALRTRAMLSRTRSSASDALADLLEALALVRTPPVDEDALCLVLSTLGGTWREVGRYDEARACWEEVVEGRLHDPVHDERVTHALGSLAMLERKLGRYDRSRTLFRQALDRKTRAGDLRGIANVRLGLGNLEIDLGRWAEAAEQYEAAIELAREIGVGELVGRLEGNLGICHRACGELDRARTCLESALDTFERHGEPRQAALARGNLGEVELAADNLAHAVRLLDDAVERLAVLGDPANEAEIATTLAAALVATGDAARARAVIDRATETARRIGGPLLLAQALARRGLVEIAEGIDARSTLTEALALASGTLPSSNTGRAIDDLRRALEARRDPS